MMGKIKEIVPRKFVVSLKESGKTYSPFLIWSNDFAGMGGRPGPTSKPGRVGREAVAKGCSVMTYGQRRRGW